MDERRLREAIVQAPEPAVAHHEAVAARRLVDGPWRVIRPDVNDLDLEPIPVQLVEGVAERLRGRAVSAAGVAH